MRRRGFTLIELAIVLVIVSLIISGVLQGQEIIEQSKIRSVLSQLNEFNTATNTFRSKYNAIPGDFNRAHAFGIDHPVGGSANVSQTGCSNNDGNGDNKLTQNNCSSDATDSIEGEAANFWVHLSNAGLVKGAYSQENNCISGTCNYTAGSAYPAAAVGNAIVAITNFRDGKINYLVGYAVGPYITEGSFGGGDSDFGSMLTPQEAYSIDSKLDDGLPESGGVQYMSIYLDGGAGNMKNITESGSSPNSTTCNDTATTYNLTFWDKVCQIRVVSSM